MLDTNLLRVRRFHEASIHRLTLLVAAALWLVIVLGGATSATATVAIVAQENGDDVVFDLAGTLDLAGLSLLDSSGLGGGWVDPSTGELAFAPVVGPTAPVDLYLSVVGPGPLGPPGSPGTLATSFSGDVLYVGSSAFLVLPAGYVSNDPLVSQLVFSNHSFDSLGLSGGTYTWALPNDSVALTIVPEPSTALLLGLGLVGVGMRRSRGDRPTSHELGSVFPGTGPLSPRLLA